MFASGSGQTVELNSGGLCFIPFYSVIIPAHSSFFKNQCAVKSRTIVAGYSVVTPVFLSHLGLLLDPLSARIA